MSKTKRDYNIKKAYEHEVDMQEKSHKPKNKYKRKQKYKPNYES